MEGLAYFEYKYRDDYLLNTPMLNNDFFPVICFIDFDWILNAVEYILFIDFTINLDCAFFVNNKFMKW